MFMGGAMSRKNHIQIGGRLLQTDKRFSQLKNIQKEKINGWLYEEYKRIYEKIGIPPDSRHNNVILNAVYDKIEGAQIWIPYGEVCRYFYSRKNKFKKRYEKSKQPKDIIINETIHD
jgi:8-oxo-dGTP diphosphatase